eukprot:804145-Prymnesium_polylepis.1
METMPVMSPNGDTMPSASAPANRSRQPLPNAYLRNPKWLPERIQCWREHARQTSGEEGKHGALVQDVRFHERCDAKHETHERQVEANQQELQVQRRPQADILQQVDCDTCESCQDVGNIGMVHQRRLDIGAGATDGDGNNGAARGNGGNRDQALLVAGTHVCIEKRVPQWTRVSAGRAEGPRRRPHLTRGRQDGTCT